MKRFPNTTRNSRGGARGASPAFWNTHHANGSQRGASRDPFRRRAALCRRSASGNVAGAMTKAECREARDNRGSASGRTWMPNGRGDVTSRERPALSESQQRRVAATRAAVCANPRAGRYWRSGGARTTTEAQSRRDIYGSRMQERSLCLCGSLAYPRAALAASGVNVDGPA